MADITGIAAEEGDTALFFGKELPVEEIAEALQTIIYETLTSVYPHVKRVYFIE